MASLTPTDEQPEVADAVAAAEASDEDNVCKHRFLVDCFMCVCMYVCAGLACGADVFAGALI